MTSERFQQFLEKFNSPDNYEINSKFEIIVKPDKVANFKTTSKINVRCKNCGHVFETEARRLLSTFSRKIKKCPNCEKGINYFLSLIKKYNLDKFLEFPNLNSEFKNIKSKITVKCKKHNTVFKIVASSLFLKHKIEQYKKGVYIFDYCEKCKTDYLKNKKLNRNTLFELFYQKFSSEYKIVENETDFDKSVKNGKITIFCPKHGKQTYKWFNLLYSRKNSIPCLKCIEEKNKELFYEKRRYTYEKVLEINNKLHDGKYEIVHFEGKKSLKDKIEIICPIHGKIEIYLTNFVKGHGCFKCARIYVTSLQKKYQSKKDIMELLDKIYKYDFKINFDVNFDKIKFPLSVRDKINILCKKHGLVTISVSSFEKGVYCPYCISSKFESDVLQTIRSEIGFSGKISKLRKIPGTNYEIDLFFEELNIGIELHGLYYHGITWDDYQDAARFYELKWKHYKKATAAAQNNILLLQIFENEWYNPITRHIWISIIRSKLGLLPNKVYARQLSVKYYEKQNDKLIEFFNNNHLHGFHRGAPYLTLEDEFGEIYSGLIIGKNRYPGNNKNYNSDHFFTEYEIIRFVNKVNYSIPGAFSKLLKFFIKNIQSPVIRNSMGIKSYIDRRINNLPYDNYLSKTNFKFARITTQPNYYYFIPVREIEKIKLLSRRSFTKNKLKQLLPTYDEKLTEMENMLLNGYMVIFDAGSLVFYFQC